jgi:hypothetical protein
MVRSVADLMRRPGCDPVRCFNVAGELTGSDFIRHDVVRNVDVVARLELPSRERAAQIYEGAGSYTAGALDHIQPAGMDLITKSLQTGTYSDADLHARP